MTLELFFKTRLRQSDPSQTWSHSTPNMSRVLSFSRLKYLTFMWCVEDLFVPMWWKRKKDPVTEKLWQNDSTSWSNELISKDNEIIFQNDKLFQNYVISQNNEKLPQNKFFPNKSFWKKRNLQKKKDVRISKFISLSYYFEKVSCNFRKVSYYNDRRNLFILF